MASGFVDLTEADRGLPVGRLDAFFALPAQRAEVAALLCTRVG